MVKAKDIAAHAGVSPATVDRVLNGRAGVSARTVARVQESIAALGYVPNPNAVALVRGSMARLLFLIPAGPGTFVKSLAERVEEVHDAFAAQQVHLKIDTIPPLDPEALCARLDQVDPATTDGVAVVVSEGDGVRRALDRLRAAGVYVVTLISDAPTSKRDHFVGVDNLAAGRTAASLMAKFLTPVAPQPAPQGKIAVLIGSMLLRDHVERLTGFLQIAQKRLPSLEILPAIEGRDSHEIVETRLNETLAAHPDIIGLYSAGAGVRGVLSALQALPEERRVQTVAHELTSITRSGLEDGWIDAVLAQDGGHEVRSAIRILVGLVTRVPVIEEQERITLDIIIRENLP